MDVALTPLEFARRTRALYPDREALVDGALRLTYEQFFTRCDRWSAALQGSLHGAGAPPVEGAGARWLDYEQLIAAAAAAFERPAIDEGDLLTINYTSGTTSRPKGVMITHRNAYMNVVGTLLHLPMQLTDRYLWTLPMFHANGWTFVWTVTAVGAMHVCLRKVDPVAVFELVRTESISMMCAA